VNISGFADTNNCCCSELSFTIPDFPSGYPSVANILFPTRKSGWFIWACSTASGMLNANRLNSSGLIDTLRDIQRSQFSYLEVLNQTADESGIGTNAKCRLHRAMSEFGGKPENICSQ
jgi:hypothetical protein